MAFPLLGTPKPQFFDSSGTPLAAGTVEVKEPDDDTDKATYPTYDDAEAATNPNDNPLTLNSRGEPANGLWGIDGEDYKIVLKDDSGSTVYTVDDVFLPVSPINKTAAETSAGVTVIDFAYPPGDVRRYGANGSSDDTAAINAALSVGGEVLLLSSHTISAKLDITADCHIKGARPYTTFTQSHDGELFDLSTQNVYIENVKASGNDFILIDSSFNDLTIDNCHITGAPTTFTEYGIRAATGAALTCNNLIISRTYFKDCACTLLNELTGELLEMSDCHVKDAQTLVLRSLPSSWPNQGSTENWNHVKFLRNWVDGINTNVTDTSAFARLVMSTANNEIEVGNNVAKNFTTTGSGTIIYSDTGDTNVHDNFFENMQGNNFLIRDKDHAATNSHRVVNNTFKQDAVSTNVPGIMSCLKKSNAIIEGNVFVGCEGVCLEVYDPRTAPYASNIKFSNNHIIDHNYPAVVRLREPSSNITISGNTVHGLTNTGAVTLEGEDDERLVSIYVSSEGDSATDIENVVISGNSILDGSATSCMVSLYTNTSAPGGINNISIVDNYLPDGLALIKGITNGAPTAESIYLDGNVLGRGVDLVDGDHPQEWRGPLKGVTSGMYDFSVNGGSVGNIAIASIPDNSTVVKAWYEVLTAPTSGGSATIAFGVQTNDAAGILAATAYNNAVFNTGYHDAIPDGTATNFTTKTTAVRSLVMTIGTSALTAGKIRIWAEYITSE